MDGNYLIPANVKRGQLILGLFRPVDLTIFSIGVGVSFLLMMIIPLETTVALVIAAAPALVTGLLVAPVPYYHNVLNVLVEAYNFFTDRQKFVWKGWCFRYVETNEK